MPRAAFAVILTLGLSLLLPATGNAENGKEAAQPTTAPEAEQGPRISPEVIEREKAIVEWRKKLDGSRWTLELTSEGGPARVVQADVLSFTRRTIGSEELRKTGYPDSNNYTLYGPTEQSVSWETMQLKEGKNENDMVIWRGDITGETMQGTVIKQRKDGKKGDRVDRFSFTGRLLTPAPEPVPPAAASEPSAAAPAPEAPVADPKE